MGKIKDYYSCPKCGSVETMEDRYHSCLYCPKCDFYFDPKTGEEIKEDDDQAKEPEYWWQKGQYE